MLVSTGIVPSPPAYGGAIESHTYVLANALGAKGIQVHYVSDITKGAALNPNVRSHQVHTPLRRFPAPFPAWLLTHLVGGTLSAWKAYFVSLMKEVEIAHFHEETSALLYLRLKPRVPVVFTLHNPPPWAGEVSSRVEAYVRRSISLLTARHVIARADQFIALSSVVAEHLIRWLNIGRERVSMIPHPVDTEFFRPDPAGEHLVRERYGLSGSYVLFVGRLDPRKGVRNMLHAVKEIRPRPMTVVVGDGVERDSLLRLCKDLQIETFTRFLGSVPRGFLPGLFSGADCVVLPSLSELSPMAVLEALSCGSPVVATNLPTLRDAIQDGQNGFLVPPGVETLRDAISTVICDASLRRRFGKNAREIIVRKHSPDSVAGDLLKVYERVFSR